jgi:hypothetical protein
MSDSLPENSFSGILRVLKLITGEEIIGLVNEAMPDKIAITLPASMISYSTKDADGNVIEYVKLNNYIANIKSHEVSIPRTAIIYYGEPNSELQKMYEIYLAAVQADPTGMMASQNPSPSHGIQLLNDLFNNEDFVNFVNDLIDNFEGVEILSELDDDDEEIESESDSGIENVIEEEPEPEPKPAKKKKSKIKPEGFKMPYKPENPPTDPESWSDNPMDYI